MVDRHPVEKAALSALVAACLGTFILLVNVTIVIVALPALARDLDAGFTTARWIVAGYALVLAALLLGAGTLADRLGHRRVFLAGLGLFLVASAICGAAPSSAVLLAGRIGQGAAAAMLFPTSLSLIAGAFPGARRASALGAWSATVGVSTTLGPLLGGVLVDVLSWRWVFFINLPTGAVAGAIVLLRVPDLTGRLRTPIDWSGQALAAGGVVGVVYALTAVAEGPWSRAGVVVPLAVGLALLALFAVLERRRAHPMLDLALLARPGLAGAAVAGFTLHCCFFALQVFLTVWLQGARGYSALATGLVFVPMAVMSVLLGPLAGPIAARASASLRVGGGLALVALGVVLITLIGPRSTWLALMPGFIVGGIGVGIANPAIADSALGALESARAGLASGLNVTCRQLGTAVGVAGLGTLLELRALRVAGQAPNPSTALDAGSVAYTAALDDVLFAAAALAVLGAAAAALALRRAERALAAVPEER